MIRYIATHFQPFGDGEEHHNRTCCKGRQNDQNQYEFAQAENQFSPVVKVNESNGFNNGGEYRHENENF